MNHPSLRSHTVRASFLNIPNDNKGAWFVADSKYPVKYLEHKFSSRKIPRVLLERVGGLVQGPRKTIYIQIQLVTDAILRVDLVSKEPVWGRVRSYTANEAPWPEWGVELCLEETGIKLREAVSAETVLTAYHARGRA